jgi:formylglycine-generating enzyme required for sulfatase activity
MKKSLITLIFLGIFGISYSQNNPCTSSDDHKMVLIPAGEFYMGAEDQQHYEKPRHKVILDAFYMDATEVTQQEFKALMGRNPAFHNDNLQKPVETVTWFDAVLFCNARSERDGLEPAYSYSWIEKDREVEGRTRMLHDLKFDPSKNGYRLPTEAQWEYACRAGTQTTYFWGDDVNGDYLWWDRNSNNTTHPVATKKPNPWGLYDMVGSVWEWTNDWFDHYTKETVKNPTGPESCGIERVLRGGSFKSHDNRYEDMVTSATRGWTYPYSAHPSDGFRCVKPVK